MMRVAVVVMSRVPLPGRTKTRLMSRLTGEECAAFHRACLQDICAAVRGSGLPGYIYWAGDGDQPASPWQYPGERGVWGLAPEDWNYFQMRPQSGGDLGTRMLNAAREVLADHDAVLLVGSDVPDLRSELLLEAADRLDAAEVVIGPAHDGGYYLLGLKRGYDCLFADVPWGTSGVLAKTREIMQRNHLTATFLAPLMDLDTWEDIQAFDCQGREGRYLAAHDYIAKLVDKYGCAAKPVDKHACAAWEERR